MPPGGYMRESVFLCLFQKRKEEMPAVLGLWSPSSIFKANCITSIFSDFFLSGLLRVAFIRTPVFTLGHPKISFPSEILHLIMSGKSLLPCRVTYSQAPAIRMWILLGSHYSMFTVMNSPLSLQLCLLFPLTPRRKSGLWISDSDTSLTPFLSCVP